MEIFQKGVKSGHSQRHTRVIPHYALHETEEASYLA